MQGFTYIAPSVLENMYKPPHLKPRSPRKLCNTPLRHFGLNLPNHSHSSGHHSGHHLDPHVHIANNPFHYNLQNNLQNHQLSYTDEMMEIVTGLPHV